MVDGGLRKSIVVGVCVSVTAVLGACSSNATDDSPSSEAGAAGVTSGAGGSSAGVSGGRGGAAGSAAASAGQGSAFWCSDYPTGSVVSAGWVDIRAAVPRVGGGAMTSPIVKCEAAGDHWLVSANGTETDGIDETTMRFEITRGYHGPGVYTGRLADGISAAFSHSDVGSFVSASATDCTICINEDALSGTVSCIGLEGPEGAGLKVGHIASGAFTCAGALPKPAELPVTMTAPLDPVVCHYVAKLGCPGALPPADCRSHINDIVLDPQPCYVEYDRWTTCVAGERPSQFACGTSDTLSVTSGACSTELDTLTRCRANVGGGRGGGGGGGPNDLSGTPECDAFCAQQMQACGTQCDRAFDCVIPSGSCREAQLAHLRCGADPSAWMCFGAGYSLVCRGDIDTCP